MTAAAHDPQIRERFAEGIGRPRMPDFLSGRWLAGKMSGSRLKPRAPRLAQCRRAIQDRYGAQHPAGESARVNRRWSSSWRSRNSAARAANASTDEFRVCHLVINVSKLIPRNLLSGFFKRDILGSFSAHPAPCFEFLQSALLAFPLTALVWRRFLYHSVGNSSLNSQKGFWQTRKPG